MSGTGYIRGDFETTVGSEANSSPTLSSKTIYIPATSASLSLNPSPLTRDDEVRGIDEPIAALEDVHAPTWALETRAYPDVLGFLLKAKLGAPTTTAGNGVITDANGWFGRMGLKPGTYEVRMDDRAGRTGDVRTKIVVKGGEVARAKIIGLQN